MMLGRTGRRPIGRLARDSPSLLIRAVSSDLGRGAGVWRRDVRAPLWERPTRAQSLGNYPFSSGLNDRLTRVTESMGVWQDRAPLRLCGSQPSRTWSEIAPGDRPASRRAGCDPHRWRTHAPGFVFIGSLRSWRVVLPVARARVEHAERTIRAGHELNPMRSALI